MVVGHQQSAVRDYLGCATAAEMYHSILDGSLLLVIDIRCLDLQAKFLHIGLVHLLECGKHPHTLIGPDRCHRQHHSQHNKYLLHIFYVFRCCKNNIFPYLYLC